jgi:hypothetical protein
MIVRSGLCTSSQLGGFITTLPENTHLNDTSIYTTPLKFSSDSFPITPSTPAEPEPIATPEEGEVLDEGQGREEGGEVGAGVLEEEGSPPWMDDRRKRQWDIIEGITNGVKGASSDSDSESGGGIEGGDGGERQGDSSEGGIVYEVPTYTGPVHYKVPKTGYYCAGTSLPFHNSRLSLLFDDIQIGSVKLITRDRTSNPSESTELRRKTGESR